MIRHVPQLSWKKESSYSLTADTLYHLYRGEQVKKTAGILSGIRSLKDALKAIPKRLTRRASNVPGINQYADDVLLNEGKFTDKQLVKQLDDLIEGSAESFNRGETEMLTLQNLVRERDLLNRPAKEKLIRVIKQIGSENPLATALAVGAGGGLTTHGLMNNRER